MTITQIIPNPETQVAVSYFHLTGDEFDPAQVNVHPSPFVGLVSDPDHDRSHGCVQPLIKVNDHYYTKEDAVEKFRLFFCGFHDASLTEQDAIAIAEGRTEWHIEHENKKAEQNEADRRSFKQCAHG